MSQRNAPTRILVVDDDVRLRDLLTRYLGEQGFEVRAIADARELDKRLQRDPPHLVVLDLMLPGEDGLTVCRRLRGAGENVPIIMLTARAEDVDRIVGLEMGADDYLPKPFNPRELVARIHAVLRRHNEHLAPGAPVGEGRVGFGPFVLDLAARTLSRDGETTPLTTGEFALIKVFVEHPRQPLAREKLMLLARGRDHEVFDRAIDVQVSRLRKLIEPDPANPRYIQTVWGFGYVYVPDAAQSDEAASASGGSQTTDASVSSDAAGGDSAGGGTSGGAGASGDAGDGGGGAGGGSGGDGGGGGGNGG
ncbi:MAG TPA: two-component system response regulator OmpR [Casimicrobiaceae bacterium]|nr:two-component system response regulator OmpR [Casimicrobiaceae bacterium]